MNYAGSAGLSADRTFLVVWQSHVEAVPANSTLKMTEHGVWQVRQESLKKPSSYDLISLNQTFDCAEHPTLYEEGKVPPPAYMHVYVDVYEHL
jgi:hypothetical protein